MLLYFPLMSISIELIKNSTFLITLYVTHNFSHQTSHYYGRQIFSFKQLYKYSELNIEEFDDLVCILILCNIIYSEYFKQV